MHVELELCSAPPMDTELSAPWRAHSSRLRFAKDDNKMYHNSYGLNISHNILIIIIVNNSHNSNHDNHKNK